MIRFLCYLDGVEVVEGVFILAITTRPDLIDPAVIRAGRIDQHILCPMPSEEERRMFFDDRLKLIRCSDECYSDVFVKKLVDSTAGFTFSNLSGFLRNLQTVFFDKLSSHDEKSVHIDSDIRLSTEDLMTTVKKVEAFGLSKEYLKLSMIYDEFKKKGKIIEKNVGTKQVSM